MELARRYSFSPAGVSVSGVQVTATKTRRQSSIEASRSVSSRNIKPGIENRAVSVRYLRWFTNVHGITGDMPTREVCEDVVKKTKMDVVTLSMR